MSTATKTALALISALLVGVAGYATYARLLSPSGPELVGARALEAQSDSKTEPSTESSTEVGAEVRAEPSTEPGAEQRPAFTLPDLEDRLRDVTEWDGKVLIVNFWATWCGPCRKEIPEFVELQRTYGPAGLQFVGIAIDRPVPVREFVAEYGINYPILYGDAAAIEVSAAFGNVMGALPYTAVIDRTGAVVVTHHGEFSKEAAEKVINALL